VNPRVDAIARNRADRDLVGQIGSAALDSAAGDFHDTWQYGVGQIHSKVQNTTKGVKAAHDNYAQVEQAIGSAMAKMSSGLGGE
jgi:hypothetical protein